MGVLALDTEDVNDAERLRHDPAMRWIVGGIAVSGAAASASQMGRFETRWLTAEKNQSALADLSGQWVDWLRYCKLVMSFILCSNR